MAVPDGLIITKVVHAESKKPDTGGVLWVHGINYLFMVARLALGSCLHGFRCSMLGLI